MKRILIIITIFAVLLSGCGSQAQTGLQTRSYTMQ